MPSLAVPVPQYPRYLDLKDATDLVDRQLESSLASGAIVQAVLEGIAPQGAIAGTFARPTHVSTANIAAYETAITNAKTAVATLMLNLKVAFTTQ